MISSIELKSNDIDDDNYSPVFQRSKKEFVLKLSEKVAQEINTVNFYHLIFSLTPVLTTTEKISSRNIMVEKMITQPIENGQSIKSVLPI
jgi:hypothetical protein